MPPEQKTTQSWQATIASTFVVLWASGFIVAKIGLPYSEPFTFLAVRYVLVAVLMLVIALAVRAPWPSSPRVAMHLAIVGLLMHGGYLGGVFAALDHGVSAGVSALIVGMQPLLTAAVVGPFLGERVTHRQWCGLLLGFGGVALVISQQLTFAKTDWLGFGFCVIGLFGITIGTLYQKRFCSDMDLRSGSCIQYIAAAAAMLALAFALENRELHWTPQLVFAMFWMCIVLSVGAVTLLWILVRRGAAAQVVSLFYLVPPTTAICAYLFLGETLSPLSIVGMAIAAVGVALVNR